MAVRGSEDTRVGWGPIVLLAAIVCLTLSTSPVYAAGDANEGSCPNEAMSGFRASLPDCRAYEVVSQADSNDAGEVYSWYGFPDGEHFFFEDFLPLAGMTTGFSEQFLAMRTSSGWEQEAVTVPQGHAVIKESLGVLEGQRLGISFTGDFSTVFVNSYYQDPFEEPVFNPETGKSEPVNQDTGMNVYRIPLTGSDQSREATLVSRPQAGVLTDALIENPWAVSQRECCGLGEFLAGSSADGSRVFFVTTARLSTAPGTAADTGRENGSEIYERYAGSTYLVGVLPDGSVPACGAQVGDGIASTLFSHEGYFYGAIAPDGSNVVFSASDCETGGLYLRDVVHGTTVKLPEGIFGGRAGTGPGQEEVIFVVGEKIYEYHLGTGESTVIGEGGIMAWSADGSRVYYNKPGEGIYLYDGGKTTLIPHSTEGVYGRDEKGHPYGEIPGPETGEIRDMPPTTPDGRFLLFVDTGQLTAYPNEGHSEVYLYDAESDTVTCISCNPSGASPKGQAHLGAFEFEDPHQFHPQAYPYVSDSGGTIRAVFETTEPLVPQDQNDDDDVYEWVNGHLYLLSSGLGKQVFNENQIVNGTHLVGASEGLENIYIQTSDSLLPGLDSVQHVFDVRVDGGFPYTAPSVGCEAEQCTAPGGGVATPIESTTEAVAGFGDLKRATTRDRGKQGALARRRKLEHALRICRRRNDRRGRIACERRARRRYATRVDVVGRHGWNGGSR